MLSGHPEIEMAMPVKPEPKFFLLDELYARGLPHYEEAFFAGKPGAWLRGEKTVSYMESSKAARRIAESFPDAKIVFVLRDPVERALSHYRFSVDNGVEPLSLDEAFRREPERELPESLRRLSMSPWAYLQRGRYARDVARYAELFPRGALMLLVYEELMRNHEPFVWLCRRLGVSDGFTPVPTLKPPDPCEAWHDEVPESLARHLADYFVESNLDLAERYGLDLSSWRRG